MKVLHMEGELWRSKNIQNDDDRIEGGDEPTCETSNPGTQENRGVKEDPQEWTYNRPKRQLQNRRHNGNQLRGNRVRPLQQMVQRFCQRFSGIVTDHSVFAQSTERINLPTSLAPMSQSSDLEIEGEENLKASA